MSMITGSWARTKLLCGNHEIDVEMAIQEGGKTLFYSCPKYYPEKREENESRCLNRISLRDFEKMLEHINDEIVNAEINNEIINLKHHKWKSGGIKYEIIEHTDEQIIVKMLNEKALTDIKRY